MKLSSPSTCRPAAVTRIVLLIFLSQFLVGEVAHLYFVSGPSLPLFFCLGDDYQAFHKAARLWLAGSNPYGQVDFVTPPPSIMPALLLSPLGEARGRLVFEIVNIGLIGSGLWCFGRALGLELRERVFLLLVAVSFISFWQCVQGGNLDGLMLSGLLFVFSLRRRWAKAVLLAVTIVAKVYSGMLLIVALRRRLVGLVLETSAIAGLLLLPFARWLPAMVHRVMMRAGRHDPLWNISPENLFAHFMSQSSASLAMWSFWMVTLAWALWHDREKEFTPGTLVRYVPWMMAAPPVVFSYVGVLALPVFAWLLLRARTAGLGATEWTALAGFLLVGINISAVASVMPATYATDLWIDHYSPALQGFGVVLLVLSSCTRRDLSGSPAGDLADATLVRGGHA